MPLTKESVPRVSTLLAPRSNQLLKNNLRNLRIFIICVNLRPSAVEKLGFA
jgi:hypothetical protein